MQDFVPRLKDHILSRLLNCDYDGDEVPFSDADRNTVRIIDNRVYASKVLRVNYTTYNLRRDQDSMNPCTHCDVMVMSRETGPNAHPYWYAREMEAEGSDSEDEDFGPEDGEDDDEAEEEYYGDL
jgi:hypothetical protein